MSLATAATAALDLAQVNALHQSGFVALLGGVFEHSPWVAQAAWPQRPFASVAVLHAAMLAALRAAPHAQRLAFLRLHPELAGREAQSGTMTDHSTFEQSALNALSRDELAELRALNAAYAQRHGFPFIIAVLGHSKAQIFDSLRERVAADTEAEHEQALQQIATITRLRLNKLFGRA